MAKQRLEALVNIPGSMVGLDGPARRVERGEKFEATEEQASRLADMGYAEHIGEAPSEEAEDETTALEELTVDALKDRAKAAGASGYSSLNKDALVELVREAEGE